MADHVSLETVATPDAVIATDQRASGSFEHYQIIKLAFGALDTFNVVNSITTNPLPVALSSTDNAVLDTINTAVETIDNAVSGAGFNITQLAGAAVPIGAGTSAAALRVTLSTDSTGQITVDTTGTSGLEVVQTIASDLKVDGSDVTQPVSAASGAFASGSIAAGAIVDLPLPTDAATQTTLAAIDTDTGNIATNTTDLPNVIGTDGSVGPSKVLSIGGTRSTGEIEELLVDSAGHLQVDVLTGGGGGTQYAEDTTHVTGDTLTLAGVVQQSADAALSTDNDRSLLQVDATGYLKVNVKAGAAGGVSHVDDATFTATSDDIVPMGALYDASPPTITDGNAGIPRMNSSRVLMVDETNSAAILADTASMDTNLGTIAGDTTSIDGKITACDTGSIAGTVTADAGTDLNTSALLTTAAHDAAFGTAGSADAQVRTVQGVASMTPLLVDGSAVTQPVSGTVTADLGTIADVATQTTLATLGTEATLAAIAGYLDTEIGAILTGVQLIDDAISGAGFNITQFAGAAVPIGSGTAAAAVRVTLASDSTGQITVDTTGTSGLEVVQTVAGDLKCTEASAAGILSDTASIQTAVELIDNPIVAHDAAVSGSTGTNIIGFEARTTENTAVDTDADATRGIATSLGKQIVVPYAIPVSTWDYATPVAIADTADDEAKALGAAGVRHYVTRAQIFNGHATVSTEVVIKDGSTVRFRGWCQAAGGGVSAVFDPPLRGTAATAVNVANITTGAKTYFNLQGYSAKE